MSNVISKTGNPLIDDLLNGLSEDEIIALSEKLTKAALERHQREEEEKEEEKAEIKRLKELKKIEEKNNRLKPIDLSTHVIIDGGYTKDNKFKITHIVPILTEEEREAIKQDILLKMYNFSKIRGWIL